MITGEIRSKVDKLWKNRNSELKTDRSGKAFFVSKVEIVENQYDLSINRYKEVAYEEVNYEPPQVILGRLKGLMGKYSGNWRSWRGCYLDKI
jgi:type I restriction enzyme M protein